MNVEFLGGARTVTGSATLLEKDPCKWLVDCGMFQGGEEMEKRNWKIQPYQAKDLSFILLTHAHIDHSGLIPKLVREGFRGKVICTKATLDLCEVMLRDSGHIQEMEAEWQNRKGKRAGRGEAVPLYTVEDAEKSLPYFQPVGYGEIIHLAEGIRVRFQDAGHILGSAIIEIWVQEGGDEKKIVFSGDLGNLDQPIVRDPSIIEEGDVLWLESTYGDRLHKSREETVQELLKIVQEAISHQAKVVIPAFAVERTQDIIYTLGQFIRSGALPPISVYVDSPLAISATEIFKKNSDCFDRETQQVLLGGENPLEIPGIRYTRTVEESKGINEDPRPGIIISASGMCDSGRIQHHLKHHLWREESHIVILGYQAEGTVGRRMIDGAKTVRLFGEEIVVKAHIHTLGGFSAHADQKGLLDWLSHIHNPQLEVFVNHGEERISMGLSQHVSAQFHLKASVPQWRERRVLFTETGKGMPEEEVYPSTRADTEGLRVDPERGFFILPSKVGLAAAERVKEVLPPGEPLSVLLNHLDRTYKRLHRKLKRGKKKGEAVDHPRWWRQLEEVQQKLEELEKEIE